ncbi:MAG: porin [Paenirhodobacter sp.]|uniref:porin n=1 Tax=Paenirhodobacter sp. TaxID=1965326 RepID=UPI003D0D38FB
MKKVLFATTALVLSAGFASAEVSLSGDGRMGVVYNGDDWNFSSRARVTFTLSGQTDGGLEFGGSFRADQAGDSVSNNGAAYGSEGSVYISGAFGKIEMGDTVSAPEALFGDLPEVGYEDLTAGEGDYVGFAGLNGQGLLENDIPYLTGDSGATTGPNNPLLLYTYSAGAFSVAASLSDGKWAMGDNAYSATVDDAQEYAIAAAYTFQNYTVGLGYEVVDLPTGTTLFGDDKLSQVELAGVANFGNTSVKAYYAAGDDGNPVDQAYGLGVSSVFGATTVMGYVQKVEFTDAATTALGLDGATWWGLGASYDLGGGASVAGGISDSDLDGSNVTADLGVKFKF